MKSRERLLRAIEFRRPDRVPVITWRAEGYEEWLRYGDHERHRTEVKELLRTYPADAFYPDTPWIGSGVFAPNIGEAAQDEWGIIWTRLKQGCIDTGHPLANWDKLDELQFPDPSFYVPNEVEKQVHISRSTNYVYVGTFGGYFQHLASLRGYENLMIDLVKKTRKLYLLADKLLEYFVKLIRRWGAIGVDGMFFGDDLGMQDRLLIKPTMWREFVKPRYREMFDAVHKTGAHVWFHTDGYVMDIVSDLVDVGVDVLNVNQLVLNGLIDLANGFGGRVCFLGGLDHQHILPFGTTQQVEEHVQEVINHLASYNGGYIAVPLSGGGYDTPFENLKAALNAFARYGTYGGSL